MQNILELFSMKGKTTVLTGAAGYICASFVETAAQAGSNVALLDIPGSEEKLLTRATSMEKEYGIKAKWYTVDISDEAQVESVAAQVFACFGHIDALVNAAGVNHHAKLEDHSVTDIERVLSINVADPFACTKHFGKYMCRQGSGSIVNICSMSGNIVNMPPQVMTAYCTSKGALKHMTHAVAAEWGEHNVRCNCLSPGVMQQGMSNIKGKPKNVDPSIVENMIARTPMHRTCAAWELCGALLYLLSDASSFTTGAEILVDGGYVLW